jgi:hypothetical protein
LLLPNCKQRSRNLISISFNSNSFSFNCISNFFNSYSCSYSFSFVSFQAFQQADLSSDSMNFSLEIHSLTQTQTQSLTTQRHLHSQKHSSWTFTRHIFGDEAINHGSYDLDWLIVTIQLLCQGFFD